MIRHRVWVKPEDILPDGRLVIERTVTGNPAYWLEPDDYKVLQRVQFEDDGKKWEEYLVEVEIERMPNDDESPLEVKWEETYL